MLEEIICSAIYVNDLEVHEDQPTNIEKGYIISGRRHNNCYATLYAIVGRKMGDYMLGKSEHSNTDQGFITSLNRYVDRFEAFKLAQVANQLLNPNLYDKSPEAKNILTSECIFITDWDNFKY